MKSSLSQKQAIIEISLAAIIWGFAFIVIAWALESFTPAWVVGLRFLLASIIFLPWIFFKRRFSIDDFKLAIPTGIFLSLTLILQTWGLRYTSATKSAFITTLYVLFVPLLESLFRKYKTGLFHYFCVFLALLGTYLICGFSSDLRSWNLGDQLTLCCSITAALHILSIDHAIPKIKNNFDYNIYQSFWAGLLAICFALITKEPVLSTGTIHLISVFSILFLTFAATAFAFWLQVRAQSTLSPSVSSILFLLESPCSAFFSFIFFKEILTSSQWVGAIIILISAFASVYFPKNSTR